MPEIHAKKNIYPPFLPFLAAKMEKRKKLCLLKLKIYPISYIAWQPSTLFTLLSLFTQNSIKFIANFTFN